jgi:DNA-binding phage protein
MPRPVNVETIEHMGKEVIVDPTDTSEDLTVELLNATDPTIYRNANKTYEKLRARIRAVGVSTVARLAKISRSVVQAFVNQGTVPRAATIAKIEAALVRRSA